MSEPATTVEIKRRVIGRPFPKGHSGNPRGKPKTVGAVRELARQHAPAALQTIVQLMRDPKQHPRTRLTAAEMVLDRAYGRPAMNVSHDGPLVALNFNGTSAPESLSPQDAYQLMIAGVIDVDPQHPAFTAQAAIAVDATPSAPSAQDSAQKPSDLAQQRSDTADDTEDPRVAPVDTSEKLRSTWERL